MDTHKLKELLINALQGELKSPTPAPWIVGTDMEISLKKQLTAERSSEDALLDFMRSEPSFEIFNDKMFNQGGSWSRVSYSNLIQWLLYIGSTEGVDMALERLCHYVELDHNPAIEILALSGIDIESEIQITNEVSLVPFSDLPESTFKQALDPPIFRRENLFRMGIDPLQVMNLSHNPPACALVKSVKLSPQSHGGDDRMPVVKYSNELYEICECLTLVGKCTPLPIAHSYAIDDWVPLVGFLGAGWSSPVHDVINQGNVKLNPEQIQDGIFKCKRFLELSQNTRDKLRVPIQRLNQARRRRDPADKAIDIGVSLESLLLGDRSEKEQISFTFRLRGAWYLGNDPEERSNLMDMFNKIYGARSIAVHTGKLSQKIKLKGREQIDISEFLDEADDICVRAIMGVIENSKFPEWNKLVLG